MDLITAGLDFGTHQTKICIKTYPNEDKRHPIFEFFKFKDGKGAAHYFLPSIVQINKDNTLSYGFVDSSQRKENEQAGPSIESEKELYDFDITQKANQLYSQYATPLNNDDDKEVLVKMLARYKEMNEDKILKAEEQIPTDDEYFYRYFKQATFSERTWTHQLSSEIISTWFLSYVIFLLEEKYGDNFNINMGIPVGEDLYSEKKEYATSILVSAYRLVEETYNNDFKKFLNETVDHLIEKTIIANFSEKDKDFYNIQIYPEAFAGLTTLTSLGKLSNGMSLIADIGGGTTDISFFTIIDNKPMIWRYWSIPKGLNYVAEKSGFSYQQGFLKKCAKEEVINEFVEEEKNIIAQLVDDLIRHWIHETRKDKGKLLKALSNRIIVYNGGGSTEKDLVQEIHCFNDVKLVDVNMWKETNLKDKRNVNKLCQLLTTAYGLSIGEKDSKEVTVSKFTKFFNHIGAEIAEEETEIIEYTDKDKC